MQNVLVAITNSPRQVANISRDRWNNSKAVRKNIEIGSGFKLKKIL